ncbi:hypothetical protein HPP92_014392 [Vanilla planifolia]|uniref:Hyccin n=1 Tax=Vanilla planifolia TaxID=51239 RepID=A0A835QFZ1_VANPL|nr:hypothetical protein HPP92_014392 [Vanilla planifolia]
MSSSGGATAACGAPTTTDRVRSAAESLSQILDLPLSSKTDPAIFLLLDPAVSATVSRRLLLRSSGAGDDHLCRWLYDTFQSTVPSLQLVVIRFFPAIAASYLARALSRQPLAGFEAVLLALYAHETVARQGKPLTINLPNLANASPYHETTKSAVKNKSAAIDTADAVPETEIAVLSPVLEPHGTIRSTKRSRIVGVGFELYYKHIANIPVSSKLEFIEHCIAWVGNCGKTSLKGKKGEWRIPLPWELLQPIIRIVGHCLLGPGEDNKLKQMAADAAFLLYQRAMQDMDSRAVLATRCLVHFVAALESPKAPVSPAETVADVMASSAVEAFESLPTALADVDIIVESTSDDF